MITRALVLHLWHIVADGGKLAPSPVTAMSSSWSAVEFATTVPSSALRAPSPAGEGTAGFTSLFFFF